MSNATNGDESERIVRLQEQVRIAKEDIAMLRDEIDRLQNYRLAIPSMPAPPLDPAAQAKRLAALRRAATPTPYRPKRDTR